MVWDMLYIREVMELMGIPKEKTIYVDAKKNERYQCDRVLNFEGCEGRDNRTTSNLCDWANMLCENKFDYREYQSHRYLLSESEQEN